MKRSASLRHYPISKRHRQHVPDWAVFALHRVEERFLSTADHQPSANDFRSRLIAPRVRVLVVDDEESIRRMVGKMLGVLGYEAVMAANGLQALNYLSSSPRSVEILITDLEMPELDGHAIIREARRIRPDLGLILMSANPQGSAPEDAILLDKPFTIDKLAECLDLALGKYEGKHPTLVA